MLQRVKNRKKGVMCTGRKEARHGTRCEQKWYEEHVIAAYSPREEDVDDRAIIHEIRREEARVAGDVRPPRRYISTLTADNAASAVLPKALKTRVQRALSPV